MYKLATIAIVATVAAGQATRADIPVHADFPMPAVPWNFEAQSYSYFYENGRLVPDNQWALQRWCSDQNKIYEASGYIDDDGNEIPVEIEVTDATRQTAIEYNQNATGCQNFTNVQVQYVNQTIATFFDNFTYAGTQYAPWELTRLKYHRLDGPGVQYFYKQSNLQLRFIVELENGEQRRVHDFAQGLVQQWFGADAFIIQECSNNSTASLFLQ